MVKISIIIPVYNAASYLSYCLNSVLSQNNEDIEIICVDDGSIDQSGDILKSYSKKYDNMIVINQSNGGVSVARNTGIKAASGEYIAFVDSDDYISEDFVENLLKLSEVNSCDLICTGLHDFNESGIITTITLPESLIILNNPVNIIKFLEIHLNTSPVAKLYKRDIIYNNNLFFEPALSLGEDRDFNLRYFLHCHKIKISNYVGYFYRRDVQNSLTKQQHAGVLMSCYDAIMLKKKLFEVNGFYGGIVDKYINCKILHLLFDEINSLSCKGMVNLNQSELYNLIYKLSDNWQEITSYIDYIDVNRIFKRLLCKKKFNTLRLLLAFNRRF